MNGLTEVGSLRGEVAAPDSAPAGTGRGNRRPTADTEGDPASRDAARASLARAVEGAVLAGRWELAERLAGLLAGIG